MPTALFRYRKNRLKLAIFSGFCGDSGSDSGGEVTFSVARGSAAIDAFFGMSAILGLRKPHSSVHLVGALEVEGVIHAS